MKFKKPSVSHLLIFSIFAVIVSCVTVNVNFPEGAVQKATDDYVKQLYDAKKTTDSTLYLYSNKNSIYVSKALSISFLSVAHAVDFTLSLDDPKIKAIHARQALRLEKINAHKSKGEIGENNKGLLEVKTDMPLLQKKIQPLVDDENKDRKELYSLAAEKNNTTVDVFTKSFKESFVKTSPPGTPIQDGSGNWKK